MVADTQTVARLLREYAQRTALRGGKPSARISLAAAPGAQLSHQSRQNQQQRRNDS
ncbi:hypothetical protein GWE18_15065 [Bradyrhizobium sp. CSA112]|uniref:hypothetical protein n=1 Tax=Bradyrhizobium sp. CSA112 TaxID=2699170 RepID=UPI0023AFDD32|nr:hypothetical protein [Bradyrhizobium sp. CSA112]MDE5454147.1 hypothetical protein [Bradyrhizobium sp. CSA112]